MTATTNASLYASDARETPWRSIAFVAALWLTWITLRPFGDLGNADALDLTTGREVVNDICFALMAMFCAYLVASSHRLALLQLRTPSFLALALCIFVSCVTSQDISRSVMRAAFSGSAAVIAACLPLLPQGRRHLALLLGIAAGGLTLLSYLGVILAPHYAVHQPTDLVEPALAGDWRGVFPHKNDASVIFVMVFFVGIFVARSGYALLGAAVAVFGLLFVFGASGKSANMLWLPTLLASLFVVRPGVRRWASYLALVPWALLCALGVGSVMFAPIGALVASLPIDPTFTGRTDVWRFALGKLSEKMFLGYGFSAFWSTESVRFGTDDPAAWVANAAHAHNGYLDAAMSMGVIGLVATLWAFVFQPLADIRRAVASGADPALVLLLTQIWLFCIYISCFESFLFSRTDPIWITFLFAVFGLRYISNFRTSSR